MCECVNVWSCINAVNVSNVYLVTIRLNVLMYECVTV